MADRSRLWTARSSQANMRADAEGNNDVAVHKHLGRYCHRKFIVQQNP